MSKVDERLKEQERRKQEAFERMQGTKELLSVPGDITHYAPFPSELVLPRPVDVWVPEGYDSNAGQRYPVIYMHDGQMLIHTENSPYVTMDLFWDVDKIITGLVNEGTIRPAIVVSVFMRDKPKGARGAEFMPQKPVTDEVWQLMVEEGDNFSVEEGGDTMSSDSYLRFLVEELKPFVDEHYATLPDRDNTFVMGSSMGGAISAYAISEYPEVFGGAACLSSHLVIGDGVAVKWFNDHWPQAGNHRVYFDYGTETLDAQYEPYQQRMDAVMEKYGYTRNHDWMTLKFEGADHSSQAWKERLHIPLTFLLGT